MRDDMFKPGPLTGKDLKQADIDKLETLLFFEMISGRNSPDLIMKMEKVVRFLWAVWTWEGKQDAGTAQELLQVYIKKTGEDNWHEFFRQAPFKKAVPIISYITDLDKEFAGKILHSLDFRSFGERSRNTGLSSIRIFLRSVKQAGVNKERLDAFCEGSGFGSLGERSRNTGLASIRNFLHAASRAGVSKDNLRAFCNGLNFRALGKRSRDVGPATVTNFLRLARQAGVTNKSLNAFCRGLNFKALGKRSRDVGLTTIMNFLRSSRQAGVNDKNLNAFCNALDWRMLGRSVKNATGELNNFLFILDLLLHIKGISRDMALRFMDGIEWEPLKEAIENRFSPDALAATIIFLTKKCGLKSADVMRWNLDLSPRKIWLRSFINYPCPGIQKNRTRFHEYLEYAFHGLITQNIDKHPVFLDMNLKSWNIFIHNMFMVQPVFLKNIVSPILRRFSSDQFTELFLQSDLKNIGIFLNWFNPQNVMFDWSLPEGINFKGLEFPKKIKDSTLDAVSHFLFNFYFLDRRDYSNYFARQFKKLQDEILLKIEASKMSELDLFMWNLWMALPAGEKNPVLANKAINNKIIEMAEKEKERQGDILGLIGTLNLSRHQIPPELTALIDPSKAKEICLNAVGKGSITYIRLLGGLSEVMRDIRTDERETYLKGLGNISFHTNVPNIEIALTRLKGMFRGV